jgi:hypothetical protein
MSDGLLPLSPASPGGQIEDVEDLIGAGATPVVRQRCQVAGATLAEVARVRNVDPTDTDYGLVTRNIPSGAQTIYDTPTAINLGLLAGLTARSFGEIATTAVDEVPVFQTPYVEQTAGAQRSIVSTSANDTAAGSGARSVLLVYYTLTGVVVAGPFFETITLNGTTPVNTVATNICFVEQIIMVTAGSPTAPNDGDIQLFTGIGGAGSVFASILTGSRSTRYAHHYVPTGSICFLKAARASSSAATGNVSLFTARYRNPTSPTNAEIVIGEDILIQGSQDSLEITAAVPVNIPGPAVVTIYVVPTIVPQNNRAAVEFYELII